MIHVYGIKNCNTMKKAMEWLDDHKIEYTFHDYKKEGANTAILEQAFAAHGWESVINRRGMSWRKLDDASKTNMNEKGALEAALKNPSLIKRPLVVANDDIILGFDEEAFKTLV